MKRTAAALAAVLALGAGATRLPPEAPPPRPAPEQPGWPFDGPEARHGPQAAVWAEPRRWEPPRQWPILVAADARAALAAQTAEEAAHEAIPPWEERKPPPPPPPPPAAPRAPAPPRAPNPGVEAWRSLVAAYFPPENVDFALLVMWCESRGDPGADNPISTAAGLFQFLESTWNTVAVPLGYGTYASGAVFDPAANIHAAATLSKGGTTWRAWTASRGCWG